MESKSKILIIGGTGKIGQWISRASLALHHPTFLLVRPATFAARPDVLNSLESLGASILQGSLEDKISLVEAIKQVDIVISAVHGPLLLAQLNIVEAIQQAGSIQRFVPSEFGIDVNGEGARTTLNPIGGMFKMKQKVRQAIEAANIPFTYLCSFVLAHVFAKTLGQPDEVLSQPMNKVIIYGDGHTKVSFLCVEDVGFFAIKLANDPRALNKTVNLRLPDNIFSQLELVSLWEKTTGKILEKISLSEEEIQKKIHAGQGSWETMKLIMKDAIFRRGLTTIVERQENQVEASDLYPSEKYTSIDEYFGNLSLKAEL